MPAELKSLTGQYLNGGMNVDDLDVLASAMTDGLPDEQMETAFNEMLFERVMKSKLTGAPVETLKRGNGSSDNKKKKKPPVTDKEIDGDTDADFWTKLKENGFQFGLDGAKGNPIAGLWQRHLDNNPKARKEYNEIAGHTAKRKFRADWAQYHHMKYVETMNHVETEKRAHTNKGHYLPLGRIAQKEGGGKDGLKAALNYCLRCWELQGTWIRRCNFARRWKFLYMVVGYEEIFEEAWPGFCVMFSGFCSI